MIRALPPLLLLLAAAAPASAAERRYTVVEFDRVRVEGPYRVTVRTGVPGAVSASGSPDALERLSIEVQGRALRIRPNRSAWGGFPGAATGPVTITVGTRDLAGVNVDGSGRVDADRLRGSRVELSLTGGGGIAIDRLDADQVSVNALGSGTIRLGGNAKGFKGSIAGSATLDAAALSVADAELTSDSAGQASLTVTRAAKLNSYGSGDIRLLGGAACTIKEAGAGQVRCGKE